MLQSIGKKLMVALATMAMVVGSLLTVTPAFAAGTDGSIAVTGNDGFEGITVYQMFAQSGEGDNAKYTLTSTWEGFFTADSPNGIGLTDDERLSDAAYTYVKNLGADNAQAVSDFAKKAAAWAASQSLAETSQANVAEGTKTATVSGLAYGYYLVVPNPKGSTDQTDPFRGTDAMLVNVNSGTPVEMELKTVYPTVDKKVEDNANHASASVGDTLKFTLTSTVPDISEYTQGYQFSFVDTLSEGLTFNEGSVHVMIGEEEVTSNCTIVNPSTGNNVLTIHFGTEKGSLGDGKYDATSLFTGKAGQTITVTYTATLNENAVVATDELNTVKVVYSNDPTTDGTGESGESKTHQYTFGFDLNKTDGTNGLAGAQFQLKKGSDVIQLIAVAGQENTYHPAKDGESEGVVDTVTTPAGGVIHFTGLAEGTYQLVETKAPQGYNKVTEPITVTIEATYNDDGTLASWKVNEDGTNHEVEVVNHAGAILPGTGGMGTVVFTVVGVAIVVCGAVWYVRRSKANS